MALTDHTFAELGQWIDLLVARAARTMDPANRESDLAEAVAYSVALTDKLMAIVAPPEPVKIG